MAEIKFSELPNHLRAGLTEKGRHELWHRVDEFGGIRNLSNSFCFSQSKLYNWKNKDSALPVTFVRGIMGENSTEEVKYIKGRGRSGKIKNPEFSLNISSGLLTRVNTSVRENNDGTPFYITNEKSLAKRFTQLLAEIGQVDQKLYSRSSRCEIRYPKFLNEIFLKLEYEKDRAAVIDEKGEIRDEGIVLEDQVIPIEEFSGELYSRQKNFELALQRENSEKIAEMMAEESNKVEKLMK